MITNNTECVCYRCDITTEKLLCCCKEPLPAPGNRSNERRYKEKDLARTEGKGRNGGEERGGEGKPGVVKRRYSWMTDVS
ncbi:hypothetical protein TNCV_4315111 [Trichonephila clavipes]|nr:hypothetical protein TNCV_4315111 [Trichonephila clavipes]